MNNIQKGLGGLAISISMIIGSVVLVEGGYSDHPEDTGGPTRYGITEKVARANGYEGSMDELPLLVAESIYQTTYVVNPSYDKVMSLSKPVAHKLIDTGVNVGTKRASVWFQASLNALNRNGKDYPKIAEDGDIGPATLAAYSSLQTIRGSAKACSLVLKLVDVQQGNHYLNLTKHRSFTVGWIDNRIQNIPISDCNE